MAVRRRKVKRYIIDVNTFITIFINRETDWLLRYVIQNKLEIFVDDNLIDELLRVLNYPRIKRLLPLDRRIYTNFVLSISTHIISDSFNIHCPDKDDNFLYDIALTVKAKLLVTGERALLSWKDSPVKTINLKAFKELF